MSTSGREGRTAGNPAGQEGLKAEGQHPAAGRLSVGTRSVRSRGVSLLGLTVPFPITVPLVPACRLLGGGGCQTPAAR